MKHSKLNRINEFLNETIFLDPAIFFDILIINEFFDFYFENLKKEYLSNN
jgi:hypothetical protein